MERKQVLRNPDTCPHRAVLPATGVCADCWRGVPHYAGPVPPPGFGVQVQCLDADGRCVRHPDKPASWCVECAGGWRNLGVAA